VKTYQGTPSEGMQLILASSASKVTIERVLDVFSYTIFSHIVSGEDFPKSKPDPAILNMLSLFLFFKENCVIEDSTNGVKSKAAGIYCVGYNSIHSSCRIVRRMLLLIISMKLIMKSCR
jgi:beta-phosphoglucomutase-like phosphatase (HAD superfamily)